MLSPEYAHWVPPRLRPPDGRFMDQVIQTAMNGLPDNFPEFLDKGECELLISWENGSIIPIPCTRGKIGVHQSDRPTIGARFNNDTGSPITFIDPRSPQGKPEWVFTWPRAHMIDPDVYFHCRVAWLLSTGLEMVQPQIPDESVRPPYRKTEVPLMAEVRQVRVDGFEPHRIHFPELCKFMVTLDLDRMDKARERLGFQQSPYHRSILRYLRPKVVDPSDHDRVYPRSFSPTNKISEQGYARESLGRLEGSSSSGGEAKRSSQESSAHKGSLDNEPSTFTNISPLGEPVPENSVRAPENPERLAMGEDSILPSIGQTLSPPTVQEGPLEAPTPQVLEEASLATQDSQVPISRVEIAMQQPNTTTVEGEPQSSNPPTTVAPRVVPRGISFRKPHHVMKSYSQSFSRDVGIRRPKSAPPEQVRNSGSLNGDMNRLVAPQKQRNTNQLLIPTHSQPRASTSALDESSNINTFSNMPMAQETNESTSRNQPIIPDLVTDDEEELNGIWPWVLQEDEQDARAEAALVEIWLQLGNVHSGVETPASIASDDDVIPTELAGEEGLVSASLNTESSNSHGMEISDDVIPTDLSREELVLAPSNTESSNSLTSQVSCPLLTTLSCPIITVTRPKAGEERFYAQTLRTPEDTDRLMKQLNEVQEAIAVADGIDSDDSDSAENSSFGGDNVAQDSQFSVNSEAEPLHFDLEELQETPGEVTNTLRDPSSPCSDWSLAQPDISMTPRESEVEGGRASELHVEQRVEGRDQNPRQVEDNQLEEKVETKERRNQMNMRGGAAPNSTSSSLDLGLSGQELDRSEEESSEESSEEERETPREATVRDAEGEHSFSDRQRYGRWTARPNASLQVTGSPPTTGNSTSEPPIPYIPSWVRFAGGQNVPGGVGRSVVSGPSQIPRQNVVPGGRIAVSSPNQIPPPNVVPGDRILVSGPNQIPGQMMRHEVVRMHQSVFDSIAAEFEHAVNTALSEYQFIQQHRLEGDPVSYLRWYQRLQHTARLLTTLLQRFGRLREIMEYERSQRLSSQQAQQRQLFSRLPLRTIVEQASMPQRPLGTRDGIIEGFEDTEERNDAELVFPCLVVGSGMKLTNMQWVCSDSGISGQDSEWGCDDDDCEHCGDGGGDEAPAMGLNPRQEYAWIVIDGVERVSNQRGTFEFR